MHGGELIALSKRLHKDPKELLDFSANLHPCGLNPKLEEILHQNIWKIAHYPSEDSSESIQKFAMKLGVPKEYLFIGNGATDLLYKLVLCFSRPVHALLISPSFSEYERAIHSVLGSKIRFVSLTKEMRLDRTYLDALDESIDVAIVCNPNNPTGLLTDNVLLDEVLEKCREKHILLCLDECFMDFVKRGERYSYISELGKYPNLVILRSFTKFFCIPGLRLGMLLTKNRDILNRLRELTPSWNLPSLSLVALEFLADVSMELDVKTQEKEREKLKQALERFGCTVYPSKANYLFFYLEDNRMDLYQAMQEHGILIRDCANYRGLGEGYYRIAIRNEADNARFMYALQNIGESNEERT